MALIRSASFHNDVIRRLLYKMYERNPEKNVQVNSLNYLTFIINQLKYEVIDSNLFEAIILISNDYINLSESLNCQIII